MPHPLVADALQENLCWRGDRAYLRKKTVAGKDRWKSLGRLAKDDARRIVKHMLQRLTAEELQQKLGMIGRSSYAKMGDVLQAYDRYVAGVEIDPTTVAGNKGALRRILLTVHGAKLDVIGADTTLLTRQLLADYSAAMVAARKGRGEKEGWDPETLKVQLQRVQRTIGSTVQQARSVFSAAALESTAYQLLSLPDLKSFLEARVGESTVVRYVPPPLQVLERIAADAAALKATDPGMWLALMLEANGGCRRSSAVEAKWDWFVEGLDRDKLPMVELDIRYAKGGNSLVRFDWSLYQEMKALRQNLRDYIIPGAEGATLQAAPEAERAQIDHEARQEVLDRLVAWLRARGLDERRAPNHELRKWYGDQKFSRHGATEAQTALGHRDQALTSTVYAQRRTQLSLRIV